MKIVFVLSISGFFLAACTDEPKTVNEVVIEVADDPQTIKANNDAVKKLKEEQRKEALESTQMKFDKMVHDFGKIAYESENHCTFIVTNTGNQTLHIDNVKASCGCTTPVKPEGPIKPGKSDKIEVDFKPNTHGEIEKTVTITANTSPKITVLKIKASVE